MKNLEPNKAVGGLGVVFFGLLVLICILKDKCTGSWFVGAGLIMFLLYTFLGDIIKSKIKMSLGI